MSNVKSLNQKLAKGKKINVKGKSDVL